MPRSRIIVHLDADAFFASAEQAADPRLRGKPVAVGGEKRGVIMSASYEARRFGIYTPMPTVFARKLCPQLVVLPGNFERYEQFSTWMFSYCYDFTPDVEQTSIDEGYFDLTAAQKSPVQIALTVRRAIGQKLKISVSEGIGANKLISAVASKLTKPAAFNHVPSGGEAAFLRPLPNQWLPGIGPRTGARLNAAGLRQIGHIAATPLELLELLLGRQAMDCRQFARGIDERPLIPLRAPQKTFSHQETFGADLTDEEYVEAVLRRMADHLFAQVRAEKRSIRTLTVKVRYNDMAEDRASESLWEPTDLETDVYSRLHVLLRHAWKRRVSLRLVSLKLSNVYDGQFRAELPLAVEALRQHARTRLAQAVDELRQTRGHSVLLRGHDLRLRAPADEPWGKSGKRKAESGEGADAPGFKIPMRVPQGVEATHEPCIHDRTAGPPRPPQLAGGKIWESPNAPDPAELLRVGTPRGPFMVSTHVPPQVFPLHEPADGPPHPGPLLPPRAERETRFQVPTHRTTASPYVALRAHSHYSFLDSTLSPAGLVQLATQHGLSAVALTDTGNLHGAAEFALAAKQAGIKPIFGVELMAGRHPLLLYIESTQGYHNLCRILSAHAEETAAGHPDLSVAAQQRLPLRREQLVGFTAGLLGVSSDASLAELFPQRFYRLVNARVVPDDFPAVACPSIRYATPADRLKYDIVQSIRTLTLLPQKHPEKQAGGRFHFRTPAEFARACSAHLEWQRHTQEIADRCQFAFPFGPPQFPDFAPADGSSARAFLRRLVREGLQRRYGQRAPQFAPQVEEELNIIAAVGYEAYFLVVWELLQECRAHGISWITRGSAADSLVCYCLGISDVCPIRFELYFKRFLNPERMALNKLPDIDVDFPHDRKDDVVQLMFARHGREHCAVVGGFSTYQARGAVGDVAKVLGVSETQIRRFTEHFPWSGAHHLTERLRENVECRDLPWQEEPYRTALEMAAFLDGVPRYPKMHPCGVVLSRQPMHELAPTFVANKGLPTTHYDMDAVEAMGLIKIDVLAQGGLAVMRDAAASLGRRGIPVNLEALEPWEDKTVWDMIAGGGARAVHHIESPAMTSLCQMAHVREIDGLIAIVSVIRPGAANESKKIKFTRRYQRMEPPEYPHPSLEPCLRSTFGLVVYEEHILQIAEAFAGLSPGHADVLRRALVKQKRDIIEKIGQEFVASARARGHAEAKIAEVWELVAGFSGYAFNKAHSTAYGVEAYQAAWLKRYYPAEFMAGVLTNGKGFYHPLVYVLECHRLGLKLLSPSVNEPGPAFIPHGRTIRVPLTHLKGLTQRTADTLVAARQQGPFQSMADFFARAAPAAEELEAMIRVGAFDEFGEPRTRQFWQAQHLLRTFGSSIEPGQGWLLPPPTYEPALLDCASPLAACPEALEGLLLQTRQRMPKQQPPSRRSGAMARREGGRAAALQDPGARFENVRRDQISENSLPEPTPRERLEAETELFGFAISDHPLALFSDVAWDTYCPVNRMGEFVGRVITTCGLVVEQRTHHQVTGEPMKFLTLADWTGMVETELFARTYRSYGLATVRYPVLEVEARVEPFENGCGFSLRVLRAGCPRTRP